ncbi:hypothetical protein Hanom_Chr14g01267851 [Helianthus anomalus]
MNWTKEEEEIALVTSIVDAQCTLQHGQTVFRGKAFQQYQQHVGNNRPNLNACQHKWRELRPKLDRFKIIFYRISAGDLSHDDRMEIAKIECRQENLSGFPTLIFIELCNFFRNY